MFSSKASKEKIAVYLAGSIKKGHEDHGFFWGEEEKQDLQLAALSKTLIFLDPSNRTDDLRDPKSVLGRDMLQIIISDAVIVDARERRGIGVGAEIDRAETQNIPVIAIVPINTSYHKLGTSVLNQEVAEWKHPFIFEYATQVAENFTLAGQWINDNVSVREDVLSVPVSDRILSAMQHYINTQLKNDIPMNFLYVSCIKIRSRIDYISNLPILSTSIKKETSPSLLNM